MAFCERGACPGSRGITASSWAAGGLTGSGSRRNDHYFAWFSRPASRSGRCAGALARHQTERKPGSARSARRRCPGRPPGWYAFPAGAPGPACSSCRLRAAVLSLPSPDIFADCLFGTALPQAAFAGPARRGLSAGGSPNGHARRAIAAFAELAASTLGRLVARRRGSRRESRAGRSSRDGRSASVPPAR